MILIKQKSLRFSDWLAAKLFRESGSLEASLPSVLEHISSKTMFKKSNILQL